MAEGVNDGILLELGVSDRTTDGKLDTVGLSDGTELGSLDVVGDPLGRLDGSTLIKVAQKAPTTDSLKPSGSN